MTRTTLKWNRVVACHKPDNIISSSAREHNRLGFTPSYENEEPRPHMELLMTNEYMRIWFKEKAVYEKDTYTREQIRKQENKIRRRFVQKMMTFRKPTKTQYIENKLADK